MTKRSTSSYHHGSLPDALQQAVLAIIEERGVAAVTMNEAARRAGVSVGAPYRHFASLDALLLTTAQSAYARFAARQEAVAGRHADPLDKLQARVEDYFDFAREDPASAELIFDSRIQELAQGLHPFARADYDWLAHLLAEVTGASVDEVRTLALAVSAVVVGQARLHVGRFSPVSSLEEAPQLAREGVELLLAGFRATTSPRLETSSVAAVSSRGPTAS